MNLRHSLDSLAQEAALSNEQLFVLVDCGASETLFPVLDSYAGSHAIGLYQSTQDAHIAHLGPWLVPHAQLTRAYMLLGQIRPFGNIMTWLRSPLGTADLAVHLRQAREALVDERTRALIRFYDPEVLPTFLEVVPAPLRQSLLSPISAWWILENETLANIHAGPAQQPVPFEFKLTEPEYFAVRQIGLPKMLHATLVEELPERFHRPFDNAQRISIAAHAKRAINLGLRRLDDLTYWVLIAFSITERLHEEPRILQAVETALDTNVPLAQAAAFISDSQWEAMDTHRPDH